MRFNSQLPSINKATKSLSLSDRLVVWSLIVISVCTCTGEEGRILEAMEREREEERKGCERTKSQEKIGMVLKGETKWEIKKK